MEKRKLSLIVCAMFFLLSCADIYAYAAEEFEIEQVQANMPEVTVYLRSEEKPMAEDLEIRMGQELLTIDSIKLFGETGLGTDYFVLVDVSNSMPDAYCESIKQALSVFSDSLGSDDKMVLLSFGEEVTTLLSGGEDKEQREQAIALLHNNDKKTLLFEAIFRTADMADKMQDNARKIVLVISDGENFAAGASTGEEAKKALGDRNMPVYAMGISDTDKENLNSFGETARTLGGTLTVFTPQETAVALAELQNVWRQTWVIKVFAESNRVDHQMNRLSIKIPATGITRSREVMLSDYQPDNAAPMITDVEKTGDRQLTVTFSEKVSGAETGTAWSVVCDDENLPVATAVYTDKEKNKILLTMERDMYSGQYVITAPGVTDFSMEENVTGNAWEAEFVGLEPEKEQPAWQIWLQNWWWIIFAAVMFILLLTLLLLWHRIKKNKGIVYVNGKASLVKNVEERQHIAISQKEGFPITLELVGSGEGKPKKIETKINGSLIVGRASMCELSLEDDKMSRQHFALEYRDGSIFLTDLQTTNGTAVNGVPVQKSHKLNPYDVITAGSLQMRIIW